MNNQSGYGPRNELENTQLKIALVVAPGMVAIIASVLAFQHIGGYIPCALCLEQRILLLCRYADCFSGSGVILAALADAVYQGVIGPWLYRALCHGSTGSLSFRG